VLFIEIICCWFLNDSLSVLLIHNVSNTSSEQADITTTVSTKIALNRPKSLSTQKLHVFIYSITLSVACFTENVQNDRLSQPHKSEDVDATFDCVVNNALVQAFPFLNDTLFQLIHSLDFPAVNSLLKDTPYFVIDRFEVWTTDIDKIDRPITTDITTRSQPANAWGGNAARRK